MDEKQDNLRPYAVGLAREPEVRAVRMLLPGVFGGLAPLLFAAVRVADAQVVGAAALIPRPMGRPSGFKFAIRVVEPMRRRGIGTALLAAAAAEARARQMEALYAPTPIQIGSEAAVMWTHMGFTASQTENLYSIDPGTMIRRLAPAYERMRTRGWVPADARVIPLCQAPPQPVADLHVRFLGGSPPWVLGRIHGTGQDAFHSTASLVLMVGPSVGGALLCRRLEPTVSTIDAVVIAPALRMGWANTMLKLHAAQNAQRDGIAELHFVAYQTHQDTRRMAMDSGARLVKTSVIPYRLL
ncbi:MAG: GNAT family N-acetyltransferase [Phycisphaeraceae bacterium]